MDTKVIKEIFIYLPSKIVEGILQVIIVSLYTRYLSTEVYGNYTLVITICMTLFLPFTGWVMHAASRYTLAYIKGDKEKAFNSNIFSLWLVTNILAVIFLSLGYIFLHDYRNLIKYAGIVIFSYSATQLLSQIMAVRKKIFYVVLLTSVNALFKLVLALIFFKYLEGFQAVILAYFLSEFLVSIITFFTSGISKNMLGFQIDKDMTKEFLSYGMPLIGLAMTSAITNFSDRFIIEGYFGPSYVAIYQGNYSIASSAFTMLMVGIMRAVNPNILRAWEDREDKIEDKVWNGLRIFLIVAVPSFVGMSVLSREISSLILDKKYIVASNVMIWVSLGMLILGISEYINKPLELHKKTKTIFLASFTSAICNVILNFIFVPKFGYITAAITTLISYLVYVAILIYKVKSSYSIKLNTLSIFRIVLSSIIMGVYTYSARNNIGSWKNIIFVIIISMLIYTFSLAISGEVKEEIALITNKIKGEKN